MINKSIVEERKTEKHFPADDGFFMPGEYEPHHGCILIWPERPGSWIYEAASARKAFAQVIKAIAESERVYVAVSDKGLASAKKLLFDGCVKWSEKKQIYSCDETVQETDVRQKIELFLQETDDAWARDVAPTFIVSAREREEGAAVSKRRVRAVNWEFNAWGGMVDGLYLPWDKDNAFAKAFAEKYRYEIYDAAPFVLEGGSIHSDGEGTVVVTEACLLSSGRNPFLTKQEIEQQLKRYLGAEKILWLPRGIYNDETNEHVDNVCAFVRPGEVVLAWTDKKDDPQYELSKSCLEYLEKERDAKGRKIVVHKLPIPDVPVCITKEELEGYVFEEGETMREAGERLAASYVNFYFSNGAVVMPAFGEENEESDKRAAQILTKLCPDRKVVQIPARDILVGGGNIHCITQQIPKK